MTFKPLSIILFLICFSSFGFAHEITITFDDLPGAPDNKAAIQAPINQRILNALIKFKVPAIGFVNEGRLFSNNEFDKKTELLKLWVNNGFDLGNHTYSHFYLSSLEPEQFQAEVDRGSLISKQIMGDSGKYYHFFRHPYLDTGATPELRTTSESFLEKQGYLIAPVTIDTDDYKFNQQLIDTPQNKEKIIQAYLKHTRAKFAFYEYASNQIFGRNIKQIWLLHVNLINSYAIQDLLILARSFGYHFVSLENALQDEAYHSADNYYGKSGVSWLYRWDFTRGKVVDWSKDPEPDNTMDPKVPNRIKLH